MKEYMKSAVNRLGLVTGVVGLLAFSGVALAGGANAAGTDPITDGMTDAGTKVALYGGAAVTLILAGLVIWLGVKYLTRALHKA